MRRLLIIVLAVVIVGAGVSAVFVTDLRQGGAQQQTSTSRVGLSIASVKQTTTATVNASNPNGGCGSYTTTTTNEGYNLTVSYSSPSPKIGDAESICANIEDVSGVAVPANQSFDFSLTFTVTDSHGNVVMSSVPCVPTGTVLPGNTTPAQGFGCGTYWETGDLVNGTALSPGAYHITVEGTHAGPGVETPVTVRSEVNVTLSAP
jgi:cytoskeletal protein RodZ